MNIVVTGGSGHAGKAIVKGLEANGHSVLNVDRQAPQETTGEYKIVDLLDYGQAVGSLEGAEAVVHVAAIPRPTFFTNEVVFRTNVMATYNVFEAAATLGIQRVIYISSTSVTGYPFYSRFFEPDYFPIDEEHPYAPQDAYALSKYLGEEIAQAFVRRTEMSIVSLRPGWIHTPETFKAELLPFRGDPEFGASNLWLYIDSRDLAQACQLVLDSEINGFDAFYLTAPDSFMKTDSQQLAKQFYPNAQIKPELVGTNSLVSSARAAEVLGYKPQYTWESYL